jgi:hypothetical protein
MNAYSITAVQSGPPPDIVYNSTLPAFNAQIVTPGYALQLDQYVTNYDWANETLGTFSAYGYVNNHWYWFTEGSIYYGNLYYNEDMFTKLNIAAPVDQASLAAAAAALTAAGIYPVAHGYQTQPEWFMNTFSDWLMNHVAIDAYTTFSTNYGSGLYSPSFASRPMTFESQPVMDIWNYLATVGSKYLAPGSITMSDGTASGLFAAQKTGMYWIGSWGAGTLARSRMESSLSHSSHQDLPTLRRHLRTHSTWSASLSPTSYCTTPRAPHWQQTISTQCWHQGHRLRTSTEFLPPREQSHRARAATTQSSRWARQSPATHTCRHR